MDGQPIKYRRKGFVSVWVGTFPSIEAAEVYFGIPDEIGVYLPPEGFAREIGVGAELLEKLEANFERLSPRPLRELLDGARFSSAFNDSVIAAANRMGISMSQGIALVHDFDYEASPDCQRVTGPLTFIGTFPFHQTPLGQEPMPRPDPRIEIRDIADDVL